jgi:multiple sugar transport system ATP-binding protein
VDHLDLRVDDGELLVLVGPPGSGKSTVIRLLAGLEELSTGRIVIGERDVTHVVPKDRDVAMVFQNYALYPHMSIADNMGFPIRVAGVPAEEVRRRVVEAADILGLTEVLEERPNMVTSRQRQQVAMGRAIVRQPQVFLMDEPLLNLDHDLREQTRAQIAALQSQLGVTTVYATSDPVEAMMMGTRVAVVHEGVLQQVGTPREVYDRPANVAVAGYIGAPAMNLLLAPVTDATVRLGSWTAPAPAGPGQVLVGVRPEDLVVDGEGFQVHVSGHLDLASGSYLRGRVDGQSGEVLARTGALAIAVGEVVTVRPAVEHVHLFDAERGHRLS